MARGTRLASMRGMLRTRAERLRMTLLTSLGLLPLACGAEMETKPLGGRDDRLHTSPADAGLSGVDAQSSTPSVPDLRDCRGVPLEIGGVDTGLVTCASGLVHRPAAVECPNRSSERAPLDLEACDADEYCRQNSTCRADADCTADSFGQCVSQGQLPVYVCRYGCVTDADCNADEACVCGESIGQCVKASCRTDADCGGYACAQFYELLGAGCGEPMQLACQTPDDQCRVAQDCEDQGGRARYCSGVSGTWSCVEYPSVACGRPFLVEGEARLAPVAARGDYGLPLVPCLDGLDPAEREQLAAAWTDVGRMEHASIAAFARFCLQLLELGAPHSLLVAAQAAMADETEHARLAFSLASHYAGEKVGPGALPMQGALAESQLEEVLRLVVREGCVGETVAALEASEALAHTEDPVVRQVLERIARDELAHAELAWRFVAWAVGEKPELTKLVERQLFTLERAQHPSAREAAGDLSSGAGPRGLELSRHGVLSDHKRASVRAAAWRDVLQPCAHSLLTHA